MCLQSLTFFLKILFIYSWEKERERGIGTGTGRERSRLHAGSLTWDSILGLQDHTLGWRQVPNRWATRLPHDSCFKSSFEKIGCVRDYQLFIEIDLFVQGIKLDYFYWLSLQLSVVMRSSLANEWTRSAMCHFPVYYTKTFCTGLSIAFLLLIIRCRHT